MRVGVETAVAERVGVGSGLGVSAAVGVGRDDGETVGDGEGEAAGDELVVGVGSTTEVGDAVVVVADDRGALAGCGSHASSSRVAAGRTASASAATSCSSNMARSVTVGTKARPVGMWVAIRTSPARDAAMLALVYVFRERGSFWPCC